MKETKFAKLLKKQGVTVQHVARKCNVTDACVRKWCMGKSSPGNNEMYKNIANALYVSVETIVRCFFEF